MLATAGAVYYALHNRNPAGTPFTAMQLSRLTQRGNVTDEAISGDGKFVAYIAADGEQPSIWIKQLAANSDLRMAPSVPGGDRALTFSPDGNYLYFVRQVDDSDTLYQLPILGGEPKRILAGVDSPISFAPEGDRFAFLRFDPIRGEASLMIANRDGSAVHPIAVRRRPAYFERRGLAWSPDGRMIACFAGRARFFTPEAFQLVAIRVADGHETTLTGQTWATAGSVVWMNDGRSLVVSASEQLNDWFQIWQLTFPSGAARRVTNDLGSYARLSITADGKTLAALQIDNVAGVWVVPAENSPAVPVSSLGLHGLDTVAWGPSGDVLFSEKSTDASNIWDLAPRGQAPRQLSAGPGYKHEQAVTPNGRYILYNGSGKIWRMDADGTNPRQLTDGAHDVHPTPSPDGRWVVYASFTEWSPGIGGKPSIWKVPIDGGIAVQITQQASSFPQVSPDGKLLAFADFPGDNPRFEPSRIRVMLFAGGTPVATFAIPGQVAKWAPDSKALLFRKSEHGVGNIWRQALRGGPPSEVTNFAAEEVSDFDVSRDGRLAVVRGRSLSDVVLIRNVQ